MNVTNSHPRPNTRAGHVHDLVHRLREAAGADSGRTGSVLRIARHLDADTARAALVVALVSESWSPEDRAAMSTPPPPDHDRIRRQNAAFRAEFAERERRATTAPVRETDVSFTEAQEAAA